MEKYTQIDNQNNNNINNNNNNNNQNRTFITHIHSVDNGQFCCIFKNILSIYIYNILYI